MTEIKEQIKKNFSKQVHTYDKWAHAQKFAAHKLIDPLTVQKNASVLDVGCGNGFLIELLLQKNPDIFLTGIDIAPGCIEVCKAKWDTFRFLTTDAERFQSREKFDLIVSGFTFQWFEDFEASLHGFLPMLQKNGIMTFNMPIHGSLKELKHTTLNLHDFPSQENILSSIQKTGLPSSSYVLSHTHHYDSPIDAIKHIKHIGANYRNGGFSFLETRKALRSLENQQNEKGFPLTYEIFFVTIGA